MKLSNKKQTNTKLKKLSIHVKVGDKVKVISGSQKGVLGSILTISKQKSLVTLEGISGRIKLKKVPQSKEAKKIEVPTFIHVSNIMLWDKESAKVSRIGYRFLNGLKVRYFKKSGNPLVTSIKVVS